MAKTTFVREIVNTRGFVFSILIYVKLGCLSFDLGTESITQVENATYKIYSFYDSLHKVNGVCVPTINILLVMLSNGHVPGTNRDKFVPFQSSILSSWFGVTSRPYAILCVQ